MSRMLAGAALTALLATGCTTAGPTGAAGDDGGTVQVVAALYPLQWLAERVGGGDVDVVGLTPPGTEPHDLQLTPRARQSLDDADVVVYLGQDYQPDVQRVIGTLGAARRLDALDTDVVSLLKAPDGLDDQPLSAGDDPHVWLDPLRMAALAGAVADAIVAVDPAAADVVAERLATVRADLVALHREMAAALADCERRTFVTSHAAFGYLADRYDLEQLPIAGLDPEQEPDPAALREVSRAARDAGVTTVFVEEALPPALAETVAAEIGARTDLLGVLEFDPAAALGDGEDYLSVQRDNAASLARGLGCA